MLELHSSYEYELLSLRSSIGFNIIWLWKKFAILITTII